ncbi:cholecystokinin receptor type A-like [Mytilus californianus]|uniref:cholecystokinin receptor type A-like n=1 Tax=Mytilus californianus TaxID=6549 RepID=UPI002246338B|nr:cholecystokinin receptor type A-like [Mytilus californianus]
MESNSTNETLISLDDIDYQQFLEKDIPATVFLILLSIIGSVGNIHTILVYLSSPVMAKLAVRVFILWLAFTDLTACLFCMPFEIFDIRYSYTFSSVGACKFFRFLNHVVTLASGGLLTAIAIERFRINTKQLHRQTRKPETWINIISGIIIGVAVVLSIPAFVFYGLNEKETNIFGLTGTDCTILSEYQNLRTAVSYSGVVILLSTICVIVCVVIYGKILYMICTQMKKEKKRKEKQNHYHINESTSDVNSVNTQAISTINNSELELRNVQTEVTGKSKDKSSKKGSKYEKGRQLTISLIVATTVSYAGYLIYVFTILVKITNPRLYENSIRPATAILLRAYFINNASNPIVFCLIDKTFRKECLKLYKKTVCAKTLYRMHQ